MINTQNNSFICKCYINFVVGKYHIALKLRLGKLDAFESSSVFKHVIGVQDMIAF